jgi:hypothetical protein
METNKTAEAQVKKEIIQAYVFLREKNMSIPSETLDFIKDAAIEKLEQTSTLQKELEELRLYKYALKQARNHCGAEIGESIEEKFDQLKQKLHEAEKLLVKSKSYFNTRDEFGDIINDINSFLTK